MRLALAQINPKVGDIDANAALIARWTASAREAGADAVVFPELSLVGYPPRDLLYQEGFVAAARDAASRLGETCSSRITLIFGAPLAVDPADASSGPRHVGRGIANSLLAYRDGKALGSYDKRLLPTYDVFDEDRYFVAGSSAVAVDCPAARGDAIRVGLTICEDLWRGEDVGFAQRYQSLPDPVADLMAAASPRLIVNPSASPFVLGKGARHREILRKHAVRHRVYVAAVNQVGGNDELIFDGHAAVFDPSGTLIAAGPGFEEALTVCDLPGGAGVPDPLTGRTDEHLLFEALRVGVRDYLRKTGFKSAVLGLSGGIDSAVTCVVAAAALGAGNVLGIGLPSRYSSEGSVADAKELAGRLGVAFNLVPIEDGFASLLAALAPVFEGRAPDIAEENLQSRIRGTILMAVSNKLGHLLLTTGNKSELAVGYCTLYGDMNGGLAVLSDTTKEYVYRLARWMNANWGALGIPGLAGPPIPEASITKPPSAELRPGQTDQDSLPAYPVLDEIIDRYVERRESVSRIIGETGFDDATVRRVVRLIDTSEFKRKQAAIGLKVTGVAFGSGRRLPIAQGWRSR
jgi:NAD+ synthetase